MAKMHYVVHYGQHSSVMAQSPSFLDAQYQVCRLEATHRPVRAIAVMQLCETCESGEVFTPRPSRRRDRVGKPKGKRCPVCKGHFCTPLDPITGVPTGPAMDINAVERAIWR